MARRRTDITRSLSVRVSEKQLVSLMHYFEQNERWRIDSLGSFVRDLVEEVYDKLDAQGVLKHFTADEAFSVIEEVFGVGRVNRNNLSLSVFQETDPQKSGEIDPYFRPRTKHEKRNKHRREKREQNSEDKSAVFSQTLSNISKGESANMPEDVREAYVELPQHLKEVIDMRIRSGHDWDDIRKAISWNLKQLQIRNEKAGEERMRDIKQAMAYGKAQGIVADNNEQPNSDLAESSNNNQPNSDLEVNQDTNSDEFISDPENSYEAVEQYRKKMDEQQSEQMKQQLKDPSQAPISSQALLGSENENNND